eukprot:4862759-Prymnesium_polylepis.1
MKLELCLARELSRNMETRQFQWALPPPTAAAGRANGAPGEARRDFAPRAPLRAEFIPSASTMRDDPAGAMSWVLVV